ncbi:MAG: hypothetical protein ACK5NG_04080 [Chthoniobacterales bacterium]
MNTRRNTTNPIECTRIVSSALAFILLTVGALGYVFLKNQQHSLGTKISKLETEISEIRSYNQGLQANVTRMTSRAAIQDKMHQGLIAMTPISGNNIARFDAPVLYVDAAEFRNASAQAPENYAQ